MKSYPIAGSFATGGIGSVAVDYELSLSSENPVQNKVVTTKITELEEKIEEGGSGKSAYDIAVAEGFEGSQSDWLKSLKGETGPQGETGPEGPQGPQGEYAPIDSELSSESENPVQNKAIVGAISNPNLLDNGDFSINQRGQSVYDATSAGIYKYTVDRWCFWKYNSDNYGTITVNTDGSLSVDGADGANDCILTQMVENGIKLVGKTVTLSLEITEITGTVQLQLHKSSASIYIDKPGVYQLTFVLPELDTYRICINNTYCPHYTIKWIKLELGSVATQFVPPNPAVELAKCQRFYQTRTTGDIDSVDLRPSMRITPTVTQLDSGNYAYDAEL